MQSHVNDKLQWHVAVLKQRKAAKIAFHHSSGANCLVLIKQRIVRRSEAAVGSELCSMTQLCLP